MSVEDNEKLFKDAPDWANWIAMDSDLRTNYHEKKPVIDTGLDISSAQWISWELGSNTMECDIKMDCHWSHSLIERVR